MRRSISASLALLSDLIIDFLLQDSRIRNSAAKTKIGKWNFLSIISRNYRNLLNNKSIWIIYYLGLIGGVGFMGSPGLSATTLTLVVPEGVGVVSSVQENMTMLAMRYIDTKNILFIFLELKIRHSLGCPIVKSNPCRS
jgi:hypothetical protein